jgi:hypothetical protein
MCGASPFVGAWATAVAEDEAAAFDEAREGRAAAAGTVSSMDGPRLRDRVERERREVMTRGMDAVCSIHRRRRGHERQRRWRRQHHTTPRRAHHAQRATHADHMYAIRTHAHSMERREPATCGWDGCSSARQTIARIRRIDRIRHTTIDARHEPHTAHDHTTVVSHRCGTTIVRSFLSPALCVVSKAERETVVRRSEEITQKFRKDN